MAHHHQKCPGCGARNTIPETGLTISCEYCGFERPVPDVEKRRKRMEREEAQRRKREEARRKAEAREARQRQIKKRTSIGRLVSLLMTIVPLIVVLFVLHSRGTLKVVTDQIKAAFGQDAQSHFENEADSLRGEGYLQQLPARAARGSASLPMSLKHGFCYALVVGANAPIKRIELLGPEAATTSTGRRERHRATLRHCPGRDQVSQARVHLASSGKLIWSLYSKPVKVNAAKAPAVKPKMEVTRSARRMPGMKSYSSRARRGKPRPPVTKPPPAAKQPAPEQRRPAPQDSKDSKNSKKASPPSIPGESDDDLSEEY